MWTASRPTAASAGPPDLPPEVGVGQRCALGAGERESTGRNPAETLAQVGHDQVCEVNHAAASA